MLDDKDEERFEEATDIHGLASCLIKVDAHLLSGLLANSCTMESIGARQTSDFRGGTQGARQSSQPVFAARKERGNPFGESSEARPQPTGQDTQFYTTFPNHMKVEKVTKETLRSGK